MTVPNIFDYATKELSQDAVICWLVACASDAEGHHRQRGLDFVAALAGHRLDRPGGCRITDVTKPERQYSRIDVYFRARVDGSLVSFVVEDKIGTRMHGDQLDRYRKVVQDDKLKEDQILLVYFKTGYVYDEERAEAEKAGFKVFELKDMLRFLRQQPIGNDHEILRQYRDYLERVAAERSTALREWNWSHGFVQYEFMKRLRDELAGIREPEWTRLIDQQHRSDDGVGDVTHGTNNDGNPWTQYWFCDHLFWRIDGYAWERKVYGTLRMMVLTGKAARAFEGWSSDSWYEWIEQFKQVHDHNALKEADFRRVMMRKGDLVAEGTVGAFKLEANAVERVSLIADTHVAFLRAIAGN